MSEFFGKYLTDFAFIFAVLLILVAWKFAIEGLLD